MNFVVSSDGQGAQDLLGFNMATPPAWVEAIPYLGLVIEFFYQAFTLHGVFSIWLPLILLGTFGSLIMKFSEDKKDQPKERQERKQSKLIVQKTFFICNGKIFKKEHFPVLYDYASKNPDAFLAEMNSVASAWHEGNITSAAQAMESDLQHEQALYG